MYPSACMNARIGSVKVLPASGGNTSSMPTSGAGCCARATCGQTSAAPPKSEMKSRRRIEPPSDHRVELPSREPSTRAGGRNAAHGSLAPTLPETVERCRLRPTGLQRLPVELDAVARTIRRDGEAILDNQRMRDVAVEPESVRFQVGAVGRGGEEMHG